MKNYLKSYRIRLQTYAPVFVGNGAVIKKKEYIYLPEQHKVIVPDLIKMYGALEKKGLKKAFEEYMLSTESFSLGEWLRDQGFHISEYSSFERYSMDAGEYFFQSKKTGKKVRPTEILCFMKDPYGQPYIPGSSLKGAIRTALLAWLVSQDPQKYAGHLQRIIDASSISKAPKKYLEKENGQLEQAVFHTINRPETSVDDVVNSVLSGLVISDGKPLSTDKLTLSQKIDYSLDGAEHRLNILRETLKPNTTLEFDITIDNTVFPYDISEVLEALDWFNGRYYDTVCKMFGRGNPEPGIVWLGGGNGFAAKTVVYSVYSKQKALEITDQIMRNTIGKKYEEHNHRNDISEGISPHMYKCTRYDGKLYDMGMTKIEKISQI